jgi:hypothetical protein
VCSPRRWTSKSLGYTWTSGHGPDAGESRPLCLPWKDPRGREIQLQFSLSLFSFPFASLLLAFRNAAMPSTFHHLQKINGTALLRAHNTTTHTTHLHNCDMRRVTTRAVSVSASRARLLGGCRSASLLRSDKAQENMVTDMQDLNPQSTREKRFADDDTRPIGTLSQDTAQGTLAAAMAVLWNAREPSADHGR